MAITAQSGAREFSAPDFTKYSYFVGGVNATHNALLNYSPLMNGFGRLFMVRPPKAVMAIFGDGKIEYNQDSLFVKFKHMLEYMNRSVTGFADKTLDVASTPIQGGFAGRQFSTPTVTKETTNEFTVGLYELVGSPVYTVIDAWMNAIGDENSGFATYGGYIAAGKDDKENGIPLFQRNGTATLGLEFNEAYHTAEFIYALLDRSGGQVERAVLLADCYPKSINQSTVLNMEAGGGHDNITYDITFNCVMYRSPIINAIATDLVRHYMIVSNSLNFNPELGDGSIYGLKTTGPDDNPKTVSTGEIDTDWGHVPGDGAVDTNSGNVPIYKPTTSQITTKDVTEQGDADIKKAKVKPYDLATN